MGKFADHRDWTAFCIALTFFVFSGGVRGGVLVDALPSGGPGGACFRYQVRYHLYSVEALDAPGSPVRWVPLRPPRLAVGPCFPPYTLAGAI